MQYKKLWIALGVVMLVSFTILGGVGYKGISNGPPTPSKVVTADGRYCLRAKRFATAKTSGSQPAGRKLERSGDTGPMSLLTGVPTICTGNRSSFSTVGRERKDSLTMPLCLPNSERHYRADSPK